ncbi:MAG: hypothetical protein AB7I27_16595 [Bacteriovoracaceae bacterium]
MKLLKLLFFFSIIYFIRKFIIFYKTVQAHQEELDRLKSDYSKQKVKNDSIEADYKIL